MMHYAVVFTFAFTVLCRATHMDADTPAQVRWQHFIALILAALSLPVYSGTSELSFLFLGLAACVLLWFERRSPKCKEPPLPQIDKKAFHQIMGRGRD